MYQIPTLYTQSQIAKILGLPQRRIQYLEEKKHIPEPKRLGEGPTAVKYYTAYDLAMIKALAEIQGDKWQRQSKTK